MTDCEFVLDILQDGAKHTLNEILTNSFRERGHGLTVHSRVSDLRKQGHDIEWRSIAGARRGDRSSYQLVA